MARTCRHAVCVLLFALASCVRAGDTPHPSLGQPGKDVMWVPTPDRVVERMLAIARVRPGDFVIDLGSGDGRVVIAAARTFGVSALGVELNPDLVRLAEQNAARANVADRAKFVVRDLFQADLHEASVITGYLLPELNLKLRPTLLALKPGTRVVMHAFDMGEWQADEFDASTGASVRLWIVPAIVEGHWRWKLRTTRGVRAFEMELGQQFQHIQGLVHLDELRLRLRAASLRGDIIRFSLLEELDAAHGVRYDFRGRVHGEFIEGTVEASDQRRPLKWFATRARPAGKPS